MSNQNHSKNSLIGPHEGRELSLMLSGEKKFAVFHDAIPPDGIIAEEIIPEIAFTPYVAAGQFVRRSEEIVSPNGQMTIRYVCFSLPAEMWRIDAFFFIMRAFLSGERRFDDADDIFIGRLLGYSEEAIQFFVAQRAQK